MSSFDRCAIDTMQSICSMEAQVSRSGPMEEETTLIGFTFGGYLLSKVVRGFVLNFVL